MASPVSSITSAADSDAAPLPEIPRAWATGHDVQFYDGEEFLASRVAAFLLDGIREGQPIIVIATEPHRRAFVNALTAMGADADAVLHHADRVWLDARETLGVGQNRVGVGQ